MEVRHALHYAAFLTWKLRLTLCSLAGKAKSIEDTERSIRNYLPNNEGEEKPYRVVYAVHRAHEPTREIVEGEEAQSTEQGEEETELLGLVNLRSLDSTALALPEQFTLPVTAGTMTLTVEIAYKFLPDAWGKGYATESVKAVFEACKRARSFWTPFSKVNVRAIVNGGNPASRRVMHKTGMAELGVYELNDRRIYLAGEWRDRHSLHIFAMHLIE